MKPKDISNFIKSKLDFFLVPNSLDRWRELGLLDVETTESGQHVYTNEHLKRTMYIVLLRILGRSVRDTKNWFDGNVMMRDMVKKDVASFREKVLPAMEEMVKDGI